MHGLYLLWWVHERHMSAALVGTVLAAGDFALLLLEVPTGWLADRFGHRRSLIVGSAAQVLGMLACWFGRGALALLAASVLVALGDAFRSGADQALLFRTCAAIGRESDFQHIQARARAAALTALVVLSLAGGAVVTRWGFDTGWAIEVALCAAGLAIACAMREPPPAPPDAMDDAPADVPGGSRMRLAPLLRLAMPAALLAGAAGAASFVAQTGAASTPIANTLVVAIVTLAEAVGSALAAGAPAAGQRTQYWLLATGAIATAVASSIPSGVFAAAIALSLLLGLAHAFRADTIQRHVPDDVRARAASISNACDMLFNMIALPVAGVWRTRRGRR